MNAGKYIYDGWRIIRSQEKGSSLVFFSLIKLNISCKNRRVDSFSDLHGLYYKDYGYIEFSEDGGENIIKSFIRDDKLTMLGI